MEEEIGKNGLKKDNVYDQARRQEGQKAMVIR